LWGRFHGQTVRLLRESELRVADASFAVDVRQGVLLHPSSTVFLRVRAFEGFFDPNPCRLRCWPRPVLASCAPQA